MSPQIADFNGPEHNHWAYWNSLLRKVQQGDQQALHTLLDETRIWLFRKACQKLQRDQAEVAVQETQLKLIRKSHRIYDGFLPGWLSTTLYREILAIWKKDPRRPDDNHDSFREGETPDNNTPSAEETLIRKENEDCFRKCVQQLPESDQRAIELYLQGLTKPQIADALGLKVDTFRSLWPRILAKLRACLEREGDFGPRDCDSSV
jgi:RNA polymerase sigma factor (sigma-70 family)